MRVLHILTAAGAVCLGGAAWADAGQPAVAQPAIPFKRDTAAGGGGLGGAGLGVLLLSLAAIAVVMVVRKRLKLDRRDPAAPRLVSVLETQRLGPRNLLSVVEFEGARYLIAHSEHGVSCLAQAGGKDRA